jgi:alkylation response protein AidB-like acyl-CoA dehydrogenase
MRHAPFALAEEFDRRLGDPRDPGRLFSYERCAVLDEREEFPLEICRELDRLGLPARYVPAAHGGTLTSFEDALQLVRAVARRDLTVAIAHGKTFLGAVSAWVGASPDQAALLGAQVAAGTVVSWGLTERDHGSDLAAGEVTARADADGGFVVDGEKWLINNANRGELVCLLARTDESGGPRGFSLLLVDKRELDHSTYRPLPQVRLHGIRGADISGIAFRGAGVPADALIGGEGEGLEVVLKSLQLTRTLCASLSLGVADHALDLATDYVLQRRMYDRRLVDLPQTRHTMAECFADLLTVEAVSLVSSRAIHALTEELTVVSAVTKYLVPTMVDRMVGRLAVVMGARSLLADRTHAEGRFQKLQRDHRIVGIFDGNTLVNLNSLVNQFAVLARGYRRGRVDQDGVRVATTLAEPLPAFDRERLGLLPRGGGSLVQSLPSAAAELRELAERGSLSPPVSPVVSPVLSPEASAELAQQVERLLRHSEELHERLAAYRPSARDVPPEAFELAERYAALHAAACCLQLWLRNHEAAADGPCAGLWRDGLWLRAGLHRLLGRLDPPSAQTGAEVLDDLVTPLLELHRAGLLPSLLPYQRAGRTS